jgi:ribose transport system ATP-binding protein
LVSSRPPGRVQVSIAKWLAARAEILIIDEPTVAIDIKTKNALHELIWDLAANGKSILLISSDMRLSDRILMMLNHAVVGEMRNTHRYDEMSEGRHGPSQLKESNCKLLG